LRERGVEATRDAAALSWLITERYLDAMNYQRTTSTIHSPTVLCVQLFESLNQKNTAISLHLNDITETQLESK